MNGKQERAFCLSLFVVSSLAIEHRPHAHLVLVLRHAAGEINEREGGEARGQVKVKRVRNSIEAKRRKVMGI